MSSSRFLEERVFVEDLLGEVLVVCPGCRKCAAVHPVEAAPSISRRFVCVHCGTNKDLGNGGYSLEQSSAALADPFFRLQLWLVAPCCGQVLWAYSLRHLNLIEAYVGAQLREHRCHPQHGWSNQSFFNRLPKWMKEAGHRDEVLRVVAKLRQSL